MAEPKQIPANPRDAREERLAEALRANLRRRKSKAAPAPETEKKDRP